MSDEIILSELSDDELVPQMHDDLYDGLKDEVVEGVNILLGRGWTPYDVLTKALVEGMRIVGIDFRDGILFVPEVLLAANSMKAGMAILKPLLIETGAPRLGKMVIGTVKGDIHDIGKNLVAMMMEGAGFEIVDLGINNPAENYIGALEREEADILGMSALLTTTMPYMKVVIDTLKDRGLRDHYVVMVGGAPLNEEFSKAIGADAYCRDAAVAVETAKAFMARKHNQLMPVGVSLRRPCVTPLSEIVFEADRPAELARFWAGLLDGYADPTVMVDGPGPSLCIQRVPGRRYDNNRVHLDVAVADREREMQRLVGSGARLLRRAERYLVLADPEGNQFCLTGP